jgi:hypothetical protein
MKTSLGLLAVPLLGAALLAGSANTVSAQDHGYALTTIENPTNQTLKYAVQWGDGEWVNYTLYAGEYRTHYYTYGPDGRHSPALRIRFDYTLSDNQYVGKEYTLTRYASFSVDRYSSKRYVFRKSAGGSYVDLYSAN